MIRILIVDDHTIVRQGLRFLLGQWSDITVVGECEDGEQAIKSVVNVLPDVVLLDLLMPKMDGVATIREMKRLAPSVHIIVLTSSSEDEHIFRAIKAGALSYLLKDSSAQELIEAIRAAVHGDSRLHPIIAIRLLQEIQQRENAPLGDLTPREIEVLTSLARGYSNHEIATALSISEPTVRTHIGNILSKLHLADRTQAAIYALQQRLVPLNAALQQREATEDD